MHTNITVDGGLRWKSYTLFESYSTSWVDLPRQLNRVDVTSFLWLYERQVLIQKVAFSAISLGTQNGNILSNRLNPRGLVVPIERSLFIADTAAWELVSSSMLAFRILTITSTRSKGS